ncbi:hypothetical protein AOLI_G00248270 [Acnodon oligacanthus]
MTPSARVSRLEKHDSLLIPHSKSGTPGLRLIPSLWTVVVQLSVESCQSHSRTGESGSCSYQRKHGYLPSVSSLNIFYVLALGGIVVLPHSKCL